MKGDNRAASAANSSTKPTSGESTPDNAAPYPDPESPTQKLSLTEALAENARLKDQLDQIKGSALRKAELKPYQAELIRMQQCLENHGKKMVVIFEGRGASGKGGAIRRITQYMNAKHYRVVAFGKPKEEERAQWFYQKYIHEFPSAGEIVLFDRSWYSRALIEPVFGYCSDREYEDFIAGVKGFEKDLQRQGIILIKFYFSVSKEEQAHRYALRREDPLQSWKLEEADLDAEDYRKAVTEAKYRMLKHTHSQHTPWTIIRSDNKHLARLNAIKVILNHLDYERMNPDIDLVPDKTVVLSGARELERMEAYRIRNRLTRN